MLYITLYALHAGVDLEWVVAPPEQVDVEEQFSVVYSLEIDQSLFWKWAVADAEYNVFSKIQDIDIT